MFSALVLPLLSHCGVRQPIHRDPSEGKADLLRKYTWRCMQCAHIETYDPDEIERYQRVVERRPTSDHYSA